MGPPRLAEQVHWNFKVEWGIDITRYRVCQELEPYIYTLTSIIEPRDRIVDTIAIEPTKISASCGPRAKGEIVPVVSINFPEGFYANLVALSDGEAEPWPSPPPNVNEWSRKMQEGREAAFFPAHIPETSRAWVNIHDDIDLVKSVHYERCMDVALLRKGYSGIFTAADGRKREVWRSRHVEQGTIQFLKPNDLPLNDPLFKADPATTVVIWPNGKPEL